LLALFADKYATNNRGASGGEFWIRGVALFYFKSTVTTKNMELRDIGEILQFSYHALEVQSCIC
jgi:hypothetical protein